ncbi:MAG: crotonase/enoyl-CoA hydratase family protein [Gammaproteobacteria bacterium]|nr:crotonase/enoyl-CoA hydratase family protein [Gammaproteobacteria bacterium]
MSNVALLKNFAKSQPIEIEEPQLKTYYDGKNKAAWLLMKGLPRPSFTPKLLDGISAYFDTIEKEMAESNGEKYDYLISGSDVEGVFNLGGDLDLFCELIRQNDRDALLEYATKSIDLIYRNLTHLNSDLTTITLVQGDALGGGFESAISANVVVAERGVKMGLPEVLFNLFPGMGAFSILSRKIGYSAAEKMILSGSLYSSEQLYEMGVVDILANKGEGEIAVYRYIKSANRAFNTYKSMQKVKDICNQISYQELQDIAKVWTDAALQLSEKDLRMMSRLVRRQNNKMDG